jgi:DNA repair exonuclease SbcCD ATPase subunit
VAAALEPARALAGAIVSGVALTHQRTEAVLAHQEYDLQRGFRVQLAEMQQRLRAERARANEASAEQRARADRLQEQLISAEAELAAQRAENEALAEENDRLRRDREAEGRDRAALLAELAAARRAAAVASVACEQAVPSAGREHAGEHRGDASMTTTARVA